MISKIKMTFQLLFKPEGDYVITRKDKSEIKVRIYRWIPLHNETTPLMISGTYKSHYNSKRYETKSRYRLIKHLWAGRLKEEVLVFKED